MSPFPSAYGHDFPRLIDELVPGFAGEIDDIVIGLEDPIGAPVVAHELPDVLDDPIHLVLMAVGASRTLVTSLFQSSPKRRGNVISIDLHLLLNLGQNYL